MVFQPEVKPDKRNKMKAKQIRNSNLKEHQPTDHGRTMTEITLVIKLLKLSKPC